MFTDSTLKFNTVDESHTVHLEYRTSEYGAPKTSVQVYDATSLRFDKFSFTILFVATIFISNSASLAAAV